MVVDTYRIAKEGKLIALIWKELNTVMIKEAAVPSKMLIKHINDTTLPLFIKNYCEEHNAQNLNKILLEKDDIESFIDRVHQPSKNTIKMRNI